MRDPEKRFTMVIPMTGVLTIEVIARTPEEAQEAATERLHKAMCSIQGGVFVMPSTSVIPIEHKELSRLVALK